MIRKTKLEPFVKPPEENENLHIFGKFQIDGYQFLIIPIEHGIAECEPLSACHCATKSDLPEIGRFWVNGQLCAIVRADQQPAHPEIDLASLLTDRELQIATLVAMGRPNKQIAHQLRISEWTVSTHLRRIFIKLSVDSRAAMVYRCASLIQQVHRLESAPM
ncbi:MAG TPA: LuxR C-terminal-related transcriptional regulator [Chroococcidiopsis sp.]